MPCYCPSCRTKVPEDCNCISCDYCNKWYHLQCTDLTESQFDIFKKDKSFEWFCQKCESNVCRKCNIITRDNVRIQCQKCENKYHLRCAGLSKTAFIPATLWYCYQCLDEIFPYNSIPVKQICNLAFNSNNLNRTPTNLEVFTMLIHHLSTRLNAMYVIKLFTKLTQLFHAPVVCV